MSPVSGKTLSKRAWAACLLAGALAFCGVATAQSYPAKPIRLVVPYAPSGLPDVLARLVAQAMSVEIGQSMLVENRAGGNTIIGAQAVASAPPDGYTLFLSSTNSYAVTPAVHAKLPYDPVKDFSPVTQALHGPLFLIVHPSLGVATVQELVARARARPGGINYGSPGNATVHQLSMEALKLRAGVDLTHVPYKGVLQAIPALLANEVSAIFVAFDAVAQHVKAGKLRAIAVGSAQRSTFLREVPTVAESGFPGFDVGTSMGFSAPVGTPRPVIDKLNAAFAKVLKSPEMEARIAQSFGMEVMVGTPEQYAERIDRERAYYAKLVKEINLKID
ncbi:MAG: Bug family tripartite tricarboxylate transporter substrate binding protein [Burkholderiales bacterium]